VPRWGGRGATAALLAASVASAIVAIVRLRPTGVLVAARSGRHLLAAAAATAPLVALHGTPTGALAALAVYGVLLGALGVVDRDEIATVLRGLRRLPPAPADDRTQAGASPSHVDRDD